MGNSIIKWTIGVIGLSFIIDGCKNNKISYPPKELGTIAFVSNQDGNEEIYLMDTNGKNQIRLTNNLDRDWMPCWSPDGKKIIFLSNRDEKYEQLYVMNADGTNQRQLTNSPLFKNHPSYSPDGKKIVFAAGARSNKFDIYVIDRNGENQIKLTDNNLDNRSPSWSPDGKKIIFDSRGDGSYKETNIYTMDIDGKNQFKLIGDGWYPRWSPDGNKIAFEAVRVGNAEIYVAEANGRNQKRLTKGTTSIAVIEGKPIFPANYDPSWSPDGKYIVFTSMYHYPEETEIYVMNANGKNQRRITNNPARDWQPSWRPIAKE